jgi:coatomer protein complex subunit gamma
MGSLFGIQHTMMISGSGVDTARVEMQVPQFAKYGQLFKSSEPVQLTEEETEYNIVVIKHVFPNHTVLQFQCTNTVQEQVLEDVSVSVDLSDAV